MKVYALINLVDGSTVGVFTSDGKKDMAMELFAEASVALNKHIAKLESEKAECLAKAKELFWAAAALPIETSADEVLRLLRQKDKLMVRRKDLEKEISQLSSMSEDKLFEHYGFQHFWREYELQGN